jgi:hypothetical protein
MKTCITDEEWNNLDNFDTLILLDAVDAVDELRGDFNNGERGEPPQLRTDLLQLHQLAMKVINEGSRSEVRDLFDLAIDLEMDVSCMMANLVKIQNTLSQLSDLCPESLHDC